MLELTAYIDESGHSSHRNCQFVGLGGLVAPSERWERFTLQWNAVLDEFLGGKPFHMRDYVLWPGLGLYEGWPQERRKELMSRLIAPLVECAPEPVAAIVSLDAKETLHPQHQEFFGNPYEIAFQQVTRGLSLSGIPRHENAGSETVSMVYAYQKEYGAIQSGSDNPENQGRAEALWHGIKKQTSFGQWMGSYSADYAANLAPFQAADLFAYEITHEFENQMKRPDLAMRWPLKQILRSSQQSTLIKLFDVNVLLQTLIDNGVHIRVDGITEDEIVMMALHGQKQIRDNLMERAWA